MSLTREQDDASAYFMPRVRPSSPDPFSHEYMGRRGDATVGRLLYMEAAAALAAAVAMGMLFRGCRFRSMILSWYCRSVLRTGPATNF